LESIAESFSQGSEVKCVIEDGSPVEVINYKASG
jgi:hypothetical protein